MLLKCTENVNLLLSALFEIVLMKISNDLHIFHIKTKKRQKKNLLYAPEKNFRGWLLSLYVIKFYIFIVFVKLSFF